MVRFCFSALLLCSFFLTSLAADCRAVSWGTLYDVTILDAPWADPANGYTRVTDIDRRGRILGEGARERHPAFHDWFLHEEGTFTPLGDPGVFTAMNDRGQFVGYGRFNEVLPNVLLPFLYEDGVAIPLIPPVAGPFQAFAYDINNRGDIVGAYEDIPYRGAHGYLHKDGVFTILDVPDAYGTQFIAVNDRGVALGRYETNDHIGLHGVLYVRNRFEYFDVPGARSTNPTGINDRGEIIGTYLDENGAHGFLLDRRGFTTLDVPDSDGTWPAAINNRGQVVGSYLVKGGKGRLDYDYAGFVYENGVFVLTDPQLLVPHGINDKGEIIGSFVELDLYFENHAFVARPRKGLDVSPRRIAAGETVMVTWSGIAAPTATDWIGLYHRGTDHTEFLDWLYVSCTQIPDQPQVSGSCSYAVPSWLAPGRYELRLLANDQFSELLATTLLRVE